GGAGGAGGAGAHGAFSGVRGLVAGAVGEGDEPAHLAVAEVALADAVGGGFEQSPQAVPEPGRRHVRAEPAEPLALGEEPQGPLVLLRDGGGQPRVRLELRLVAGEAVEVDRGSEP